MKRLSICDERWICILSPNNVNWWSVLLAAVQQCTFKEKRQNIQHLQWKEKRKETRGGGEHIFRKWWQALKHVQRTRSRKTAFIFMWYIFFDDRKKSTWNDLKINYRMDHCFSTSYSGRVDLNSSPSSICPSLKFKWWPLAFPCLMKQMPPDATHCHDRFPYNSLVFLLFQWLPADTYNISSWCCAVGDTPPPPHNSLPPTEESLLSRPNCCLLTYKGY